MSRHFIMHHVMRMYGGVCGSRAGHILEHDIGLGEWQEGRNNHRS